ncbi:hypothetical protein INQ51_07930 [Maribellus sp. CM-23]|uniref:hypothetical protein n=1 Tax=Maribellus sp. CM-23 TaxID=2781026 RepID=UPI001F3D07A8|nr:hypothetical protein [Maribellus sp. CM-23]MCE4564239.1 hypothetical protein [Maribellus sp. CM-23]
MTFSIKYKPLFEVRILHQYFLNKGASDFFSMSEADKEKQLAGYKVSKFFLVVPTAKSRNLLAGQHLVFSLTNTGFMIWVQVSDGNDVVPLISLDDALELTFLLQPLNHTFINYTNLMFSSAGKLFFFSNTKLDSEPVSFPLIPLLDDHLVVSENFVLTTDGQKDIQSELTPSELKKNLFGLIKIRMKADVAPLNVTVGPNEIKTSVPVFEILFENRKTVWRYIFETDQQVKNKDDVKKENGSARQLITKDFQPLTEKGFVSIELDGDELPNPNAQLVKPNSIDNKIYSEIYM